MTERQIEYQQYLTTDYWKQVSERVKEKAGFRCQVCNSSKQLEAHHRTYEHLRQEMEFLGDLVCLCRRCHGLYHESTTHRSRSTRLPRKPRMDLATRRENRFFRRSAVKLGIRAEVLRQMGHAETRRLLIEKEGRQRETQKARAQRRRERKERKMGRLLENLNIRLPAQHEVNTPLNRSP